MAYENLDLKIDGELATLTFTRVKALNALNNATLDELGAALDEAEASNARVLVITGAGKAFVAGADISQMPTFSPDEAKVFSEKGSRLFVRIEASELIVIAAVNGFALGGGCELVLACDFAYASERAKFGQPEVNLGIIAGFGGTQRLTRKVSYGMAMELLVSGRMIKADEALRIGLVNKVCAPDELLDAVHAAAAEILSKGPIAVRLTKTLVQNAMDVNLAEGLIDETTEFQHVFGTKDRVEGVTAFLEKRKAEFKGE